jgi:hypothetical protein
MRAHDVQIFAHACPFAERTPGCRERLRLELAIIGNVRAHQAQIKFLDRLIFPLLWN